MLHLLREYAKDHHLCLEPGFKRKYVHWGLVFDGQGNFKQVIPFDTQEGKKKRGRAFKMCPHLEQPELKRGRCRHFLVDTVEVSTLYTGRPSRGAVPQKLKQKHESFVNHLQGASDCMPILKGIALSLNDSATLENIQHQLSERQAKTDERVTIVVQSDDITFIVDQSDWHDWWKSFRGSLVEISPRTQRCFASGAMVKPVLTHLVIGGLTKVGGATTGDRLASFKQDSFRSFGLQQAENAAVSDRMATAYRAAIEDLVDYHGDNLIGAKVVHWFKEKVEPEDDPLPWLISGDESEELNAQHRARKLLTSIRTGNRPDLQNNFYYGLTLSGAAGRVMVRDWMEGQFEELVENVDKWFSDLAITDLYTAQKVKSPSIERVITSMLRERKKRQKNEDWIKPVGSERVSLWRAAIQGDPIPFSVIARLVDLHRNFCINGTLEEAQEQKEELPKVLSLLYARMGLLKAYHIRKDKTQRKEPSMKRYLNEEHPHPAYHFGRLLAILAYLQRKASEGKVKAGVVQRYYSAASSTPGLMLGRLISLAQYHLSKLEQRKESLASWGHKTIGDILSRINPDELKRTLDLEEQSLFALGYYQQMAHRESMAVENNAREEETNNE